MSTIKRDKLAEEFSQQGWDEKFKEELATKVENDLDEEFDFRSVYVAREIEKRSFKVGYDAGLTEAQDQAKVLVEALKKINGRYSVFDGFNSSTGEAIIKFIEYPETVYAREALEQYRKATNDE